MIKKKYLLFNQYIPHKAMYEEILDLPYALLKLGGDLKKKGNQVVLFDAHHHRLFGSELKTKLNYLNSSFLGFDEIWLSSDFTYYYSNLKDSIKILREIFPESKIVLGGILAKLSPDKAKSLGVDVVYQENIEESKWSWTDLSLLDYKPQYDVVLTSRGCNSKCTYCASYLINKKYECRNPVDVVDEIEYKVNKFKIKEFKFIDDNILLNYPNHFEIILDEIIKRNLKIIFSFMHSSSYSFYTPEIIHKLKKAGYDVNQLFISYELSNPNLLDNFHRARNDKLAFTKRINELKKEFKTIYVFLFLGFIGQSINDVLEDVYFLKSLGLIILFSAFTPIPKTEEYKKIEHIINEKNLDLDDLEPTKFLFYNIKKANLLREIKKIFHNTLISDESFLSFESNSVIINKYKQLIKRKKPNLKPVEPIINFENFISKYKLNVDSEIRARFFKFIENNYILILSTSYKNYPFSRQMYYVFIDNCIVCFTFKKSQKIKHIKQNPFVSLLIGNEYSHRAIVYAKATIFDNSFLKAYFWHYRYSTILQNGTINENICLIIYKILSINYYDESFSRTKLIFNQN